MYPSVFVAKSFFDDFEAYSNELRKYSLIIKDVNEENKRKSLERIRDLFLSSILKTNLTDKEALKYYKSESFGNFESLKDYIFSKAVLEQRIRTSENIENYENINQCFFTDDIFDDCKKKSIENGVIILGKNFLKEPFFLDNSFLNEDTDSNIAQIKKAKHPCSSLVVIDGFLFEDNINKAPKIPNLISLIKNITNLTKLIKPFEVDLIIQNPSSNQSENKNELLKSKFAQLLEGLKRENVSLHLYAKEYVSEKDRYFITNYSTITIGHPLDRKSNISSNFYPSNINSQSIKSSYNYWKTKIDLARRLINDTPDTYKHKENKEEIIAHLRNDNLKHSIFNY